MGKDVKTDMSKEKWYLYVLRYDYSGNYYVGTTTDLTKRMLIHWRRQSKNRLPKWSFYNHSKEGFRYYWFDIIVGDASKGNAEHCEYALAKQITDKINDIKNEKNIRKTHIGNGCHINNHHVDYSHDNIEKKYINVEDRPKILSFDLLDTEITKALKPLNVLETERGSCYQVECIEIGRVPKHLNSEYCKTWSDVAFIELQKNNNEQSKNGENKN